MTSRRPSLSASPSGPVVETSHGLLRGVADGDVDVFRGVPSPAPPVGPLRFAAPSPPAPWSGVRDGTARGDASPQMISTPLPRRLGAVLGTAGRRSEDCLVLSVHAPSAPLRPADAGGRPVLVWLHGGAYAVGRGEGYDASPLAREGDVVVVTVNYRLGVFGFLDLRGVLAGTPAAERVVANAGLRDQVAALEWVARNIAAFGGDPARVTLAGESAGAGSATALMTAPSTRGLFRGVIAASGALSQLTDPHDAAAVAREVVARLEAFPEHPERLWDASAPALLAAMRGAIATRPQQLSTRPVWDGDLLPASESEGLAAAADRAASGVALLAGTNRDEHAFFTTLRFPILPLTRSRIAVMIAAQHGADGARRVLAHYPDTRAGLARLGTHTLFTVPTAQLLDACARAGGDAWGYRLDWRSPFLGMGAFHALDLALVFPPRPAVARLLLGRPDPEVAAMARRLRARWLTFVREGHPGDGSSPRCAPEPGWPRHSAPARPTLLVDRRDRVEGDPDGEAVAAWSGLGTLSP